jgi:glutamate-1-semialdehyde 2,1-aminomutase
LITKYGIYDNKIEFLKYLREISWKNGTLLIFDEITSGFRLNFGGYYQFTRIIPDMIILGKIIGGGMPIGVIVGLERLLNYKECSCNNYEDGIINENMIALSAGISTLKLLSSEEIYKKLDKFGKKIAFDIKNRKSKTAKCRQIGSIIWPLFEVCEMPDNPDQIKMNNNNNYKKIYENMLKKGYYLSPSPYEAIYLSNAHDEKQINKFSSLLMEEITDLEKNHKERKNA